MANRSAFALVFAPEVVAHLRSIDRKYHRLIRNDIHEQLRATPDRATRNRKPLTQPAPFDAEWELRLGPHNRFRVFYDIDRLNRQVLILAIGVKKGNRLVVGGEEMEG